MLRNQPLALGPKDRQLVAPSVRAGESSFSIARGPNGPVEIVAHLRRSDNLLVLSPRPYRRGYLLTVLRT